MRTKVSTKGQIVIPSELRERDHVQPGEEFDIERIEPGGYRLTRTRTPPNLGLVDWLVSAPEKGWFTEVESESGMCQEYETESIEF